MKIETRILSHTRILPSALVELKRLGARLGLRESTYRQRVLEAHARKQVLCPTCGREHPIHEPERS